MCDLGHRHKSRLFILMYFDSPSIDVLAWTCSEIESFDVDRMYDLFDSHIYFVLKDLYLNT